jgi:uncharacterized pyridoxamine 5'-phosphate oxidase family protein
LTKSTTRRPAHEKITLTILAAASLATGPAAQGQTNPTKNKNMQDVYNFIKKCGTYFIATVEGDQPRVRPFGTANIFDGKLYIQTGRAKNFARQIKANPKIEISAFDGAGQWIRIQAVTVEDDRRAAKQSMLDAYPSLKARYSADDNNTLVLYLKDATATIASFTGEPKVIKF